MLNAPRPPLDCDPRGAIAQLGERLDRTQEVAGSSPASSIAKGPETGPFAAADNSIVPFAGPFASPLTGSNRRPLLTMERLRQPVAAGGNGFGLFSRFQRAVDLPLIAAGCNHGAP